jgi:hypothetical protein
MHASVSVGDESFGMINGRSGVLTKEYIQYAPGEVGAVLPADLAQAHEVHGRQVAHHLGPKEQRVGPPHVREGGQRRGAPLRRRKGRPPPRLKPVRVHLKVWQWIRTHARTGKSRRGLHEERGQTRICRDDSDQIVTPSEVFGDEVWA